MSKTDRQIDRGDEEKGIEEKRREWEEGGRQKRESSQFTSHLMLPTLQCDPSNNTGQGTCDHRLRMKTSGRVLVQSLQMNLTKQEKELARRTERT